MREAIVPFAATTVLAFVVHRWLGDELERERRLSPGAGAAALALFLLYALLVAISALGGVMTIGAPRALALPAGLALTVVGGGLAISAVRALGSRERFLAMRADEVVRKGPYRFARNPFSLGRDPRGSEGGPVGRPRAVGRSWLRQLPNAVPLSANDVSCVWGLRWSNLLAPATALSLRFQTRRPRLMSDS